MEKVKRVLLAVLDGWGISGAREGNAILLAGTPHLDRISLGCPMAPLQASGLSVGLPEGQMGNSEVGHMNIGAGRVVYQDLVRVNKAVEEKELDKNEMLLSAFNYAKKNGRAVHLIGLVSDGGVHSHINHLKGICTIAHNEGVKDLFVHAFTD